MDAVVKLNSRQAINRNERVCLTIIGPRSLHGLEEACNKRPTSQYTLKCITNYGKLLRISREHFSLICKQKDSKIYSGLESISKMQEKNNFNILSSRGKLLVNTIKMTDPVNFQTVDLEIKFMNEVRKKYFAFGPKDEENAKHN